MRAARPYRVMVLGAGLVIAATVSAALAQAPGYPPPPAPAYPPPPAAAPLAPGSPAGEIAACLCLQQETAELSVDWTSRQQAYNALRDELARLDAELQSARAGMDVNNPQSVAQFRQLLERRDAAYKQSIGPVTTDLNNVIARYNARVGEFNSRCANRPRDPVLLQQVQATLNCPPPPR